MIIYKIEPFLKNKMKIFVNDYSDEQSKYILDNGYFCFLYKTEVYKYKLKEGSEISDKIFNNIIEDLKSRTNNKCTAVLTRSFQTKKMLFDKLKLAGYNEYFINLSIQQMEDYNYINDEEFARNYFENYKNKKSLKVIKQTLVQKGVSRDIIDEVVDDDFDQKKIINNLVEKKLKGREWDSLDYKEKSKIKAYIYSKGYKFPDDL